MPEDYTEAQMTCLRRWRAITALANAEGAYAHTRERKHGVQYPWGYLPHLIRLLLVSEESDFVVYSFAGMTRYSCFFWMTGMRVP